MRKTLHLFLIVFILPFLSFSQAFTDKSCIKDLDSLIGRVSHIQYLTISLSISTATLHSGDILNNKQLTPIDRYLKKITSACKNLHNEIDGFEICLGENNKEGETNFRAEASNFWLHQELMNNIVSALDSSERVQIYAAQIDYVQNSVTRFLTVTGNFKQYLQSIIPAIPDSLLQHIKDRLDTTDDLIKDSKKTTQQLSYFTHKKIPNIEKITNETDLNTSEIIRILKVKEKDKIGYKSLMTFNTYTDDLFGVSYWHRAGNDSMKSYSNYVGVELIVPVQSINAKNPGGFLLYGLRDDKLLLQVGIGYLKTGISSEDISWKAGFLYLPKKFGLGLSYSPLTNIGLQLAYKW